MGPPYGKRDPYHSHISRDSYGSSMGMGVPLLGVPRISLEWFSVNAWLPTKTPQQNLKLNPRHPNTWWGSVFEHPQNISWGLGVLGIPSFHTDIHQVWLEDFKTSLGGTVVLPVVFFHPKLDWNTPMILNLQGCFFAKKRGPFYRPLAKGGRYRMFVPCKGSASSNKFSLESYLWTSPPNIAPQAIYERNTYYSCLVQF